MMSETFVFFISGMSVLQSMSQRFWSRDCYTHIGEQIMSL